jgi:hypothetical protein
MAINLLPQNLQKIQKHRNYKLISVSSSLVLLIALVAATAGVFSYRYVVTKQYSSLENEVSALVDQIEQKKTTEWYLSSVQDRTFTVSGFLDSRLPFGDVVRELEARSGDFVELQNVTVGDNGSIEIEGVTASLTELASYAEIISSNSEVFSNIFIDKLRFNNREYEYSFAMNIKYIGGPVFGIQPEQEESSSSVRNMFTYE